MDSVASMKSMRKTQNTLKRKQLKLPVSRLSWKRLRSTKSTRLLHISTVQGNRSGRLDWGRRSVCNQEGLFAENVFETAISSISNNSSSQQLQQVLGTRSNYNTLQIKAFAVYKLNWFRALESVS